MEKYIQDLCEVIRHGEMENTYKMVWIRSIIETCVIEPELDIIHFDQLSRKIFGYYWNQTIYFDLEQSPNPKKRPEIYQLVVSEIDQYRSKYGFQPQWFSKIENKLSIPIIRISKVLSKDVCWRFPIVSGAEFDLYELDKKEKTIRVKRPDLLREYSQLLFELINYRWVQKLEEFNHAPRIAKKVRGTDGEKLRRASLTKFKEYLDIANPDHICFYTGVKVNNKDLAIDHVLPWSYLFSDDLWNLVYVDRSYNSSKGNRIPSEEIIQKLEKRNILLLKKMNDLGNDNKHMQELQLSIDDDLVRKFWVGCQG